MTQTDTYGVNHYTREEIKFLIDVADGRVDMTDVDGDVDRQLAIRLVAANTAQAMILFNKFA